MTDQTIPSTLLSNVVKSVGGLKQKAANPSGFIPPDFAKSILPKLTLSQGIPPALAAMPAATAVSELAAAERNIDEIGAAGSP